MWETLRVLLGKVSVVLILLGVGILLVAAAGGIAGGPVHLQITDIGFRIAVAGVGVVLAVLGIYAEFLSGWQLRLLMPVMESHAVLARELAAFRDEFKISNPAGRAELKIAIETINQQLDAAGRAILVEVQQQQRDFARDIQRMFNNHAEEISRTLKIDLRKEFDRLTPQRSGGDSEQLATRFAELTLHAMRELGDFHRLSVESKSAESHALFEQYVNGKMHGVSEEVRRLASTVEDFSKALLLPSYEDGVRSLALSRKAEEARARQS